MENRPSVLVDHASAQSPNDSDRNAFVFGFTPQAELWNGRLAMLGFAIFLLLTVVSHVIAR